MDFITSEVAFDLLRFVNSSNNPAHLTHPINSISPAAIEPVVIVASFLHIVVRLFLSRGKKKGHVGVTKIALV